MGNSESSKEHLNKEERNSRKVDDGTGGNDGEENQGKQEGRSLHEKVLRSFASSPALETFQRLATENGNELVKLAVEAGTDSELFKAKFHMMRNTFCDRRDAYESFIRHLICVMGSVCSDEGHVLVVLRVIAMFVHRSRIPCPTGVYKDLLITANGILNQETTKLRRITNLSEDDASLTIPLLECTCDICLDSCLLEFVPVPYILNKKKQSPKMRDPVVAYAYRDSDQHVRVLGKILIPSIVNCIHVLYSQLVAWVDDDEEEEEEKKKKNKKAEWVRLMEKLVISLGASLRHLGKYNHQDHLLDWFCRDSDGLKLTLKILETPLSKIIFCNALYILPTCGPSIGKLAYTEATAFSIVNRFNLYLMSENYHAGEEASTSPTILHVHVPETCAGAKSKLTLEVKKDAFVDIPPLRDDDTTGGILDDEKLFQSLAHYLNGFKDHSKLVRILDHLVEHLIEQFQGHTPEQKNRLINLLTDLEFDYGAQLVSFPSFVLACTETRDQFFHHKWMFRVQPHVRMELFVKAETDVFLVFLANLLVTEPPIGEFCDASILALVKLLNHENGGDGDWTKLCCTLSILDAAIKALPDWSILSSDTSNALLDCMCRFAFFNDVRFNDAIQTILETCLDRLCKYEGQLRRFIDMIRSALGNRYGVQSLVHEGSGCALFLKLFGELTNSETAKVLWVNMDLSRVMLHFVDAYCERNRRHATALQVISTHSRILAAHYFARLNAKRSARFCEYGSVLASCSMTEGERVKSMTCLFHMLLGGRVDVTYDTELGFHYDVAQYGKIARLPDTLDSILVFMFDMPRVDPKLFNQVLQTLRNLVSFREPKSEYQNFILSSHVTDQTDGGGNDDSCCYVTGAPPEMNELIMKEESVVNATSFVNTQQSMVLQLLDVLQILDDDGQFLALEIIASLGKSYTPVRQLKAIFRKIWQVASRGSANLACLLAKCISSMIDEDDSHFYMDGQGSGLRVMFDEEDINGNGNVSFGDHPFVEKGLISSQQLLNSEERNPRFVWPSQNGLSFSVWVLSYGSSLIGGSTTLFDIRSVNQRYGISLTLRSEVLIATVWNNGRPKQHYSGIKLIPGQWCHIGLVCRRETSQGYFYSSSSVDTLEFYVNGKQAIKSKSYFPFKVNMDDEKKKKRKNHELVFGNCCIGDWTIGSDNAGENLFHGSMRTIRFWYKALDAKDMHIICRSATKSIYENYLALRLDVSAVNSSTGVFLDTSPGSKLAFDGLRPYAASLGTRACLRKGAKRAMLAVGGINAVLPLLALENSGETTGCALYLLGKLLVGGKALFRTRGFISDGISIVSYLLGRLPAKSIDQSTVKGAIYFVQRLESDWLLYQQGIREILLNLRIWCKIDAQQPSSSTAIFEMISQVETASIRSDRMRKLVGIPVLINELFHRAKQPSLEGFVGGRSATIRSESLLSESDILEYNHYQQSTTTPVVPLSSSRGRERRTSSNASSLGGSWFSIRTMIRDGRYRTTNHLTFGTRSRILDLVEQMVHTIKAYRLSPEEYDALVSLLTNMDIDEPNISTRCVKLLTYIGRHEPKNMVNALNKLLTTARRLASDELPSMMSTIDDSSTLSLDNIVIPMPSTSISSTIDENEQQQQQQSPTQNIPSLLMMAGSGRILSSICVEQILVLLSSNVAKTVVSALELLRVLLSQKVLPGVPESIWLVVSDILLESLETLNWEEEELEALCSMSLNLAITYRGEERVLAYGDALQVFLTGVLPGLPCGALKETVLQDLLQLVRHRQKVSCQAILRTKGWQTMLLKSMCPLSIPCPCSKTCFSIFDVLHYYHLSLVSLEAAKRPDKYRQPPKTALEQTLEVTKTYDNGFGSVFALRLIKLGYASAKNMKEHHRLTVGLCYARSFIKVLIGHGYPFHQVLDPSLLNAFVTNGSKDSGTISPPAVQMMTKIQRSKSVSSVSTTDSTESDLSSVASDCLHFEQRSLSPLHEIDDSTLDTWIRAFNVFVDLMELLHVSPLTMGLSLSREQSKIDSTTTTKTTTTMSSSAPSHHMSSDHSCCKCRCCQLKLELCLPIIHLLLRMLRLSIENHTKLIGVTLSVMIQRCATAVSLLLQNYQDELTLSAFQFVESEVRQCLHLVETNDKSFRCSPAQFELMESSIRTLYSNVSKMTGLDEDDEYDDEILTDEQHSQKEDVPTTQETKSPYNSFLSMLGGSKGSSNPMEPISLSKFNSVTGVSISWVRRVSHASACLQEKENNDRKKLIEIKEMKDKIAATKWTGILKQVTHERGTWGEGKGFDPRFWKLDLSETSKNRLRVRIRPNLNGSDHKDASSKMWDSQRDMMHKKAPPPLLFWDEGGNTRLNLFRELSLARMIGVTFFNVPMESQSPSSQIEDTCAPSGSGTGKDDRPTPLELDEVYMKQPHAASVASSSSASLSSSSSHVLRGSVGRSRRTSSSSLLLSTKEVDSVQFKADVVMITTGENILGTLVITKTYVKFLRSETQMRTDGSLGLGKRWHVKTIRRVQTRRYNMEWTALEMFTGLTERKSYMFSFDSRGTAKIAVKSIAKLIKQDDPFLSPMERARMSGAQQAWVRGDITNLEYLICLNDFAGRSYVDLAQYPIFPWILADYTSMELNLNDPKSFRDLRFPIGAQTEKKQQELRMRYDETRLNYEQEPSSTVGGPSGGSNMGGGGSSPLNSILRWPILGKRQETMEERHGDHKVLQGPPWHFGTHYSSRAIVLWYLIRLEPFTSLHIDIQGGRFDHGDRQFHSLAGAYEVSTTLTPRELIPEFFCNPEFLRNRSKYDLGCKQDGSKLGDVILPPWCGGSPEDFIRIHRQALESEYVSQNLHHWIDLTFGYKQQGPQAEEALNVYFHLMYEGAVDLQYLKKVRPDLHATVMRMVEEYGQSPPILFHKPHPSRETNRPVANLPLVVKSGQENHLRIRQGLIRPVLFRRDERAVSSSGAAIEPSSIVWISNRIHSKHHMGPSPPHQSLFGYEYSSDDVGCFLFMDIKRKLWLVHVCADGQVRDENGHGSLQYLGEIGAPFGVEEGLGPHMFGCRILSGSKDVELTQRNFYGNNNPRRSGKFPLFQGEADSGDEEAFFTSEQQHQHEPQGSSASPHHHHQQQIQDHQLHLPPQHQQLMEFSNILFVYGTGFWDSSFRSISFDLAGKYFMNPAWSGHHRSHSGGSKPGLPSFSSVDAGGSLRFSPPTHARTSSKRKPPILEEVVHVNHSDITTCVALTEDGRYMLTGSVDCCVFVWRLVDTSSNSIAISTSSTSSSGFASSADNETSSQRNKSRGLSNATQQVYLENILLGHDDAITSIAASSDLDLVFSASLDGTCIVHTLEHGFYLRSISLTTQTVPSSISTLMPTSPRGAHRRLWGLQGGFSSSMTSRWMWVGIAPSVTPVVTIWFEEDLSLYSYSINGHQLSTRRCGSPMYAFCYSNCGEIVACVSKQQVVYVYDTFYLKPLYQSSRFDSAVVSISCFEQQQNSLSFLIGLENGQLSVLTMNIE